MSWMRTPVGLGVYICIHGQRHNDVRLHRSQFMLTETYIQMVRPRRCNEASLISRIFSHRMLPIEVSTSQFAILTN